MLSINDVPMYPQKYTKLILPISMATIYFLKSIYYWDFLLITSMLEIDMIIIVEFVVHLIERYH